MKILLTNDDGIYAKGLKALYKALMDKHELCIVAPESERSAVGHAITLSDPIKVKKISLNNTKIENIWAISGTPADCVKLAIYSLAPWVPDLVISGINQGANVGLNLLYSGTVSAATEAAILGIKAIAVSLNAYKKGNFNIAAQIIKKLIPWLCKNFQDVVALNINIPDLPITEIRGIKITRQSTQRFIEKFEKRVDPRGNIYYWQATEAMPVIGEAELDTGALARGYISITPIHYDLTSHNFINNIPIPQIDIIS